MKFILVVVLILSDSIAQTPTMTAAEFNGEAACRSAADDLEAAITKMQSNVLATVRCYPKGDG
jgi:hypothetical protein